MPKGKHMFRLFKNCGMKGMKSLVKNSFLFKYYQECLVRRHETKRFLKEAKIHFASERGLKGSFSDYKHDCRVYRVDYSEYMYQYEFWNLTAAQKREFVARAEMQSLYRKIVKPKIRELFYNKVSFLQKFSAYVHRKWLVVKTASFEEFCVMINSFDCIAKPIEGSLGNGIFKIGKGETLDKEALYNDCVKKNILLEECVVGCDEIEEFHPASLNTIRVVTISNANNRMVFGAFLRMGNDGNCVDNAHAGGIFAQIDIEKGIVESDGITTQGTKVEVHPYSGKVIKGFEIPHWEDIKVACLKATKEDPDIYFTGWDVCVLKDGRVELIEGNHAPDFDLMQSPLKTGVRQKLNAVLRDFFHCDLDNYFYK